MGITELVFPVFKGDAQTQSQLEQNSPEMFAHFRGVPGIRTLFRGGIVRDGGEPVEPSSGRNVLVLEWDRPSSFHAFFPESDAFKAFVGLAKPLLGGPPTRPELFDAAAATSAPCSSSAVTQMIKVSRGESTQTSWAALQKTICASGNIGEPAFFYGNGIEHKEDTFLGMIGWRSLEDYERSRADAAVLAGLGALRADGEMLDIVAKLAPVDV
ncbi:hypothetical protein N3K66_000310 [Trichothecium roseum]|uniref:Uncharacterized protein n=1 Tax=Trichothecium roseum TaxID=47278 RepID=A0ACC0VBJ2_9HYPO|nr:hypothetical protein N3K66_000310 [Trichothecium roseum]